MREERERRAILMLRMLCPRASHMNGAKVGTTARAAYSHIYLVNRAFGGGRGEGSGREREGRKSRFPESA